MKPQASSLALWQAMASLLQEQSAKQQAIALAVSDDHGELLAFVRMEGASLQAGVLAQNKAYTAARDRQPSAALGAWSRATGRSLDYWGDSRFTGFGGGLPLWHNGQLVAAVGVSGLSEDEDVAVAERFCAHWRAASPSEDPTTA